MEFKKTTMKLHYNGFHFSFIYLFIFKKNRFYDVSKQILGAGVVHLLNIIVSYVAGSIDEGDDTNPCVWYVLIAFSSYDNKSLLIMFSIILGIFLIYL